MNSAAKDNVALNEIIISETAIAATVLIVKSNAEIP